VESPYTIGGFYVWKGHNFSVLCNALDYRFMQLLSQMKICLVVYLRCVNQLVYAYTLTSRNTTNIPTGTFYKKNLQENQYHSKLFSEQHHGLQEERTTFKTISRNQFVNRAIMARGLVYN
jgi:hypothetical protein